MSMLCPVCNSRSVLERTHPEIDIYRCPHCDHCFSDMNSLRSRERYHAEYYGSYHENWFDNPNAELFENIHAAIRSGGREGMQLSLSDVGCGKGDLLRYLRDKDQRLSLTGIDLTFNDAGISLAALEHVTDVSQFVEKLRGLCETDRLVMIMTLNDRSIIYATARMLSRIGFPGAYNRLCSKHHLHHFNTSSLRLLVENAGQTIMKTLNHSISLAAVDFPPDLPCFRRGPEIRGLGNVRVREGDGRNLSSNRDLPEIAACRRCLMQPVAARAEAAQPPSTDG